MHCMCLTIPYISQIPPLNDELPNLVVKTAILFMVMVTGNSSICILACTPTSFPTLLGTSFIHTVKAFQLDLITYSSIHWDNLKVKNFLQGRNRDSDVENGLVDTAGEGEGGTNWESSIETYTLAHVKQITSGRLLCNTGSSACCSVIT